MRRDKRKDCRPWENEPKPLSEGAKPTAGQRAGFDPEPAVGASVRIPAPCGSGTNPERIRAGVRFLGGLRAQCAHAGSGLRGPVQTPTAATQRRRSTRPSGLQFAVCRLLQAAFRVRHAAWFIRHAAWFTWEDPRRCHSPHAMQLAGADNSRIRNSGMATAIPTTAAGWIRLWLSRYVSRSTRCASRSAIRFARRRYRFGIPPAWSPCASPAWGVSRPAPRSPGRYCTQRSRRPPPDFSIPIAAGMYQPGKPDYHDSQGLAVVGGLPAIRISEQLPSGSEGGDGNAHY